MKHQRSSGKGLAVLLALFLAFCTASRSFGQDTSATLTGTVADGTGAAVPGATLSITNAATKFRLSVTSGSSGEYTFQNLTPGIYDLHIEAPGFQTVDQKGIKLDTAQQGRSNVTLSVGASDQTVEVNAQLPTINYTDPTLSGSVEPEVLQDFPLIVSGAPRSSVSVATMMPGVSTGGGGNAFNARINGGMVSGDEAIVDGATTMEGYMNQSGMVALQTDFGMSPDITSEVTVLGANYDAQYGNTTSGQLVIETRSGSDYFHGAIYEYFRNEDLNAFPWNFQGTRKPQDRQNDYGAAVGGFIPGLRGANKFLRGYFYFNYEGFQERGGANPTTLSIPSAAARTGNFAAFGSQLYYPNDPAKYGALAGTAIPGNVINPIYQDPIAKAYLAALPTPTNNAEFNNYFIPAAGQGSLTAGENVYFGRFDFNVGHNDHAYYTSWWQRTGVNRQSNLPLAISTAEPADPENALIQRINWEHTFTSSMTNRATLGYLNRNEGYFALAGPTSSSLPGISGVANTTYKPQFNFGNGYTQLGNNAPPTSTDDKTTRGPRAFNDVFTKVLGKHTIKAGYEWRLAGTSIHLANNQGGTFTFNPDTTGSTACPSTAPCPGDSAASFYLGAVGGVSANYYNVRAIYPRQYGNAIHIGDSWRATQKLTLDYSLRWDYITPFKEKYDHLSFFDPNGPNPGAVTAGGTQLKGRLAFAGNQYGSASYGADYPEIPFKKAFAPRLGFAYAVDDKTVVRAGYGIYFGQAFYPGWSGGIALDGFNKSLSLNEATAGAGQTPAIYLSSGISAAQVGPTQTISSAFDNGQNPLYRPLDANKRPYSQQWNLTIERQLPKSIALTASYVGTKGTHLPSALNPINVLNPYSSTIQALGSDIAVNYNSTGGPAVFAKHGVSVPYVGWQNQLTGCNPTLGQALLPYPQYCSTLTGLNENHAASIYHSLQLKAERRFTRGLYILSTFTLAKLQTDASDSTQSTNDVGGGNQGNNGAFSPYDITSRRFALAPDNVPAIFQLSLVYDLPFGKGRQFMNKGIVGSALGGFTVSPLYRYEYGTPVSFYSSSCPAQTSTGGESGSGGIFRVYCVPSVVTGTAYAQGRNSFRPYNGNVLQPLFNRAAFQTSFTSLFDNGGGSAVPALYGPSYKNWDISVQKNTRIMERVNLKLYANFFNAFNNHYFINSQNGNFGGPNAAFNNDVSNANFGLWNGSVSNPRTIQFAGRVEF